MSHICQNKNRQKKKIFRNLSYVLSLKMNDSPNDCGLLL